LSKGTEVIYSAFDISMCLITGIITEKGIINPQRFQEILERIDKEL